MESEEDTIFQLISNGKNTAPLHTFEELVQMLESELLSEMDNVHSTLKREDDLVIGEPHLGGQGMDTYVHIIQEEDEHLERGSIILGGSKFDPTKSITETYEQLLTTCQLMTKTLQTLAQMKSNVQDFISR